MTLPYRSIKMLDGGARVLRAIGLGRVTRAVRNLLARLLPAGVTITVDGITLSGAIRDRAFLYKVKDGTFEPATVRLFADAVRPGAVVLDVGAYLGYYTTIAARRAGDGGKVVAVEPNPESFAFLQGNLRANGCTTVVAVQRALSDTGGRRLLYRHPTDPSRASLLSRAETGSPLVVECITGDELLGEASVDVVKIDVEGAEPLVLAGMANVLRRSPQAVLFIELNPPALVEAGSSPDALVAILRSLGFSDIRTIDEERDADGTLLLANLYCRRAGPAVRAAQTAAAGQETVQRL